MRKVILSAVAAAFLVSIIGLAFTGYLLVRQNSAVAELRAEVADLRQERDLLAERAQANQEMQPEPHSPEPVRVAPEPDRVPQMAELPATVVVPLASMPQITTNANGKRSYFFAELQNSSGEIIAREAQFRELLGYTKLSFRTSQGIRYFNLDDVHPEIVRILGFDADVLKSRQAEEIRQAQVRALHAQHQMALRNKALGEQAERDKAAIEKLKAEAAMRDAEARERLADAAERSAAAPKQQIIQKPVIVVPYGRIIPNNPGDAPPQPQPQPQSQPHTRDSVEVGADGSITRSFSSSARVGTSGGGMIRGSVRTGGTGPLPTGGVARGGGGGVVVGGITRNF